MNTLLALHKLKDTTSKANTEASRKGLPPVFQLGQLNPEYRLTPAPRVSVRWGWPIKTDVTVYILHLPSSTEITITV